MTALAAWWSKWRPRYIVSKQHYPLWPSDPIPYLPATSGAKAVDAAKYQAEYWTFEDSLWLADMFGAGAES